MSEEEDKSDSTTSEEEEEDTPSTHTTNAVNNIKLPQGQPIIPVSSFPINRESTSYQSTSTVYAFKKKPDKRLRNEWSQAEDEKFLEGIKKYKQDFAEIQKLLPHRSRSQIRTHYRYLAKNIRANEKSEAIGGKKVRRLRTRGRPNRKIKQLEVSDVFKELSKEISKLEKEMPTKKREEKPNRLKIGSMMEFDANPGVRRDIRPLYVPIITPDLHVPTLMVQNSSTTVPGIEAKLNVPLQVPPPTIGTPTSRLWHNSSPSETGRKKIVDKN